MKISKLSPVVFTLIADVVLFSTFLASPVGAQQTAAPTKPMKFCAGSSGGNYTFAAKEIASRITGTNMFPVIEIVTTDGSLANLRGLIDGSCDFGFAQSDVADLFRIEKPGSLSVLYPFKEIYNEYTQILCPVASGWTKLTDLGDARKKGVPVKMIVGKDGTGTAETWRAIRQANPESYDKIERNPMSVDIEAASKVKDSKDTCMIWVSGLNSGDMQAANDSSIRTRSRKPALALISIDDAAIYDIKDANGQPIYTKETVTAQAPVKDKPGIYNNLIPDRSSWYSSADNSVTVATVHALLMTTNAYRESVKDKTRNIVTQIEDAQPTIWNRVNPSQQ